MGRDTLRIIPELRDRGVQPRVHPNGFIQLDITAEERLHVWHPSLPYRQKTFSPIHNHTFGFESRVYAGRMVNVVYGFDDKGRSHEEWQVRIVEGDPLKDGFKEETLLVNVGNGPVGLVPSAFSVIQPGETYTMAQWAFHETLVNEPTLTIINKVGPKLNMGVNSGGASVMVPVGEAPDNEFRRADVDPEAVWELIFSTARRGGYLL